MRVGSPPNTILVSIEAVAREPYVLRVNDKGERFMDETTSAHHKATGYNPLGRPTYTLFDQKMLEEMTAHGLHTGEGKHKGWGQRSPLPGLDKEIKKKAEEGLLKMADSWDKLAKWIGAAPEVLKATIDEYNSFCDQGYDEIFAKDRRYLVPLRTPPFYALKGYSSFLGTIGGIKINERTEVLDKKWNIIPGLYAAGTDACSIYGDSYVFVLPGNTMGFALNTGRIAGENAAEYAKSQR